MAAISSPAAHFRGRIAALTRSRTPDDPELIDARRNLRAEMLATHVQKVLAASPTLTDEHRARIADMLIGGPR
jgi:hypothetical protein